MPKAPPQIRVALVEDDQAVREGLGLLIDASPTCQSVGVFPNAEKFLARLPALKVDVLLMDIGLPGMSGIDCMRKVQSFGLPTKVMMLTVFDDDERIFKSLEAGASGYLLKQTLPAKLLEAIRELHQGGSPMSAPIARRVIQAFHRPAAPAPESLTPRETQILEALARGLLYKEIAEKLQISVETVRTHIHNIYQKLHVRNRTEAVMRAFGQTQ